MSGNDPQLTVVIPTLGRPTLPRVLALLEGQRGDEGAEVIVAVDPRAPHRLRRDAVCSAWPRVRFLNPERAGASAARNAGWRAANAPTILFLGDDILPTPLLVREHLEWHRRHPQVQVGVLGFVRWSGELRVTPFMRWLEQGFQFDYQRIQGIEAGWGRFYTANASVKKALLERVGGFDENALPYLYEDLDLAYRASKLGFRLLYNRAAIGEHLHDSDIESWRLRIREVARAERAFVHKHPELRPHFYRLFADAMTSTAPRGIGARLAQIVPRRTPWLGERAWASLDAVYRRRLAPDFLDAWNASEPLHGPGHGESPESEPPAVESRSSGGSEPGGPK